MTPQCCWQAVNFPSEGSQRYGEGRAEHHELYPLSLMAHRMASQDCNKRSRQDLLTEAQAWKTKAERKRKREEWEKNPPQRK